MSLNDAQKLPVVGAMDSRLRIESKRPYVAVKGSLVNSAQQFNATNVSNNSVQITCNPPSRGIAISRLVFKRFVYDITISGTNAGAGPLLVEGFYAPRCLPITSTTQSEQITINNSTITQAPISQYWGALLHYHNEFKNRFGQFSLAPSMLDQSQNYEDVVNSVRNPLAPYDNNSYEQTRGGFAGLEVLSNPAGGTTATLRLTTT